ncbi:PepSY-associated TM helix domain-containing protein [Methylobacterium sp. Leaf118]|uniref:PepSY-associated TM helix domain-containing protein n=1 Tax=Methylobacterium sp. Leaf118 TaxID=2876562 RepID=UPI001E3D4C92|nr:PepSY domain-containing protein [Methylobacterium sp. Leaf118]
MAGRTSAAATDANLPRLRAFRLWSAVHTWTSLICTAFLLLLCLTGLPLIFHHELNHALGYEVEPPTMPAGTPHVSLDRIAAAALERRPGEVIQFVSFGRDEPDVAVVSVSKSINSDFESNKHIAVDLRTGTVLGEPKLNEGPIYFLLKLHVDMFLGLPGKLFLGAMGLLFMAAIVSGAVLYGPFMKKLPYGTVRRSRPRRIRWLDWHNLIGVTTLTWALVVGATGTINALDDLILKAWQAGQLAEMTAPYQGAPRPSVLSSLEAAVSTAKAAAPGMTPRIIAYPGTMFTSNNHYAVFMAGDTPLTARLLKPALIDAATGRLTDLRAMPWYVQTVFVAQPLHFGDYGGLPLKVIWAMLDVATIVVLGGGLYLWMARRRKGGMRASGRNEARAARAFFGATE